MASDRPARPIEEIFAAAAAASARADDLEDALAQMLGLAGEVTAATAGGIFVLDADHDRLEPTVTFGPEAEAAESAEVLAAIESVADNENPLAETVRARVPTKLAEAQEIALFGGRGSALLVPLSVRREGIEICLGVMALGFDGPLPERNVLSMAEPLADLAALAVERALAVSLDSERAAWFDRLAQTDPLTGLANRRTLESMLELEVARAGRQGAPMAIVLFEVDHLDEIQRTGGNVAGDGVLRKIAQILAGSVRLIDTVARYDEDRFILLAPGPDGRVATERLVREIAGLPAVEEQAITVSAGLANFPVDGRTPEELLAVAERSLRTARESGGGKVVAGAAEE